MNRPYAEYQLVAKVDYQGNIEAPKFNVSFFDDFNAFVSEDFDNFTEMKEAINRDNIVDTLYVIAADNKDAQAIFDRAMKVGLRFGTLHIPALVFRMYQLSKLPKRR